MTWLSLGLAILAGCGFRGPTALGDDGANPTGVDAPSGAEPVVPDAAPSPDGTPITGSLVVNGVVTTETFDLTAEGTLDWAEWGMTRTSDFIHKATGGMQISNVSVVGGGSYIGYGNTYAQAGFDGFTWSDGTPTASSGPAQYSGIYISGMGHGLSMTVPASTTTHVLRIYVGTAGAHGTFTAHLSDGSAPDYVDTTLGAAASSFAGVYAVTYRAASAGQTLSVSWVQRTSGGGDVNWSAASLK